MALLTNSMCVCVYVESSTTTHLIAIPGSEGIQAPPRIKAEYVRSGESIDFIALRGRVPRRQEERQQTTGRRAANQVNAVKEARIVLYNAHK